MKAYDVRITQAAHADIFELTAYIANVKKNTKAAKEHMDGCYETIASLSDNPLKFKVYDRDPYLEGLGIRFVQFRSYMIAFRVVEEKKSVEVYGVLYGAMDIPNRMHEHLGDRSPEPSNDSQRYTRQVSRPHRN